MRSDHTHRPIQGGARLNKILAISFLCVTMVTTARVLVEGSWNPVFWSSVPTSGETVLRSSIQVNDSAPEPTHSGLSFPTDESAKNVSMQTQVAGLPVRTKYNTTHLQSLPQARFDVADEDISAACRDIPDTRSAQLQYLSEMLQIKGEMDEFGRMSRYARPVSVIRKLLEDGLISSPQNAEVAKTQKRPGPYYAVNFGARDGKGDAGNTDPAYPLFAELGFHGMAVEASPSFFTRLQATMSKFPVRSVKSFITVENAVSLIQQAELPAVDVFKIDIDSFDCDVTPRVLVEFQPSVVIAEYNVYFPPPIKMKLVPSASGYDSEKRSNVYECSIQFLNDDVMRPLGYVLLQLDWQNVIYARQDIAKKLAMPNGIDIQAAYHRGYTTQPERKYLYPWGDWEDFVGGKPRKYGLDHLLDVPSHEQRMAAALKWARLSIHKQKEGAIIGCGNDYTKLQWPVNAKPR